jgi:HdeA/HdeB family
MKSLAIIALIIAGTSPALAQNAPPRDGYPPPAAGASGTPATYGAQVTVDVVKITCEQLSMEELPFSSRDVIFWLSGYYHREHNNTVIEPGAIKRDANNLNRYCYQHGEMTVMDAVKNMGLGK